MCKLKEATKNKEQQLIVTEINAERHIEREEHTQLPETEVVAVQAVVQEPKQVAGPPAPEQGERVGKFSKRRRFGGLTAAERHNTPSDEIRKGKKKTMFEKATAERKLQVTFAYKKVLDKIDSYARMDITALSKSDEVERERLLYAAMKNSIKEHMDKIEKKQAKNATDELEYRLLSEYSDLFDGDTGTLNVPENAAVEEHDDKMFIYSKRNEKEEIVSTKDKIKFTGVMQQPLFSHSPSISDVRQGGLGDCYLLAALSQIVAKNPELIKGAMKDEGNSVVVRFYKQGTPVYIRVTKSVPKNKQYAYNCLWVQMIEKAYAASGLHHDGENNKDDYRQIKGGNAAEFLETFTGIRSTTTQTRTKRTVNVNTDTILFETYTAKMEEIFAKSNDMSTPIMAEVYKCFFGEGYSEEEYQDFDIFVTYVSIATADNRLVESKDDVAGALERMEQRVKAAPLVHKRTGQPYEEEIQRRVKEAIINRMHDEIGHNAAIATLKRHSYSKYPDAFLEAYNEIEAGEKRGAMMSASSIQDMKNARKNVGANAPEELEASGVYAKHAYTIMGVKEIGDRKYIKLRNPHAVGVREYFSGGEGAEVQMARYKEKDGASNGIFLLELKDFIEYFRSYNISHPEAAE